MRTVGEYLHLPSDYCEAFGDLRWSADGECVEYPDGGTFAFMQELILFLTGFGSFRPLIHFPCLLHLLHLLGRGRARHGGSGGPLGRVLSATTGTPIAPSPGTAELCRAFARTGQPLWQAGVLCAVLCKNFAGPASPPDVQEVVRLLSTGLHLALSGVGAEVPPLAPAAFEALLARSLSAYTPDDLDHWLRHGTGPVRETAGQLANELLVRKPPALGDVLGELGRRERLAGALPFVAQLAGALSLPPRRLDHQEMPLGGYSDVATRGHPEQILPSQFALDGPEFIRRFAENELLFFRREEPHEHTREELVLLLDQGVRTWGTVRVLLAAAVLALGQRADRKRLPFLVATTGGGGRPLDPLKTDPAALGQAVEASDLSPHPGLALERVLEERPGRTRDVVLLTHPRNLMEPDVAAAARRVARGTRLFGLTATEAGEVRLSELRHGTPVELSRFRVDLSRPAEAAPPAPRADTTVVGPWHGDSEKIPFPFIFGLGSELGQLFFDFDESGEWLLLATFRGILYLLKTDGTMHEILPRGNIHGSNFAHVEAVLGVVGGFVVVGVHQSRFSVVHYHLATRTIQVHSLGAADASRWTWYYFREEHSVVVRDRALSHAVDLSTRELARPVYQRKPPLSRAEMACTRAANLLVPPPQMFIGLDKGVRGPRVGFHEPTGRLWFYEVGPGGPWSIAPMADGRPSLKGYRLLSAAGRGGTIATAFASIEKPDRFLIHLFGSLDGSQLSNYRKQTTSSAFALSPDGRMLALQTEPCPVVILDTRGGSLLCSTPRGRFHHSVRLELGPRWLWMQIEQYTHLIEWDKGKLAVTSWHPGKGSARSKEAKPALPGVGVAADAATLQRIFRHLGHDPWRFVSAAVHSLIAVLDRFGQVALLGPGGELVCMFFAFRLGLAAWMPDGTCFGPRALLGRTPTPGADIKIGAALRDACNRGGRAGAP